MQVIRPEPLPDRASLLEVIGLAKEAVHWIRHFHQVPKVGLYNRDNVEDAGAAIMSAYTMLTRLHGHPLLQDPTAPDGRPILSRRPRLIALRAAFRQVWQEAGAVWKEPHANVTGCWLLEVQGITLEAVNRLGSAAAAAEDLAEALEPGGTAPPKTGQAKTTGVKGKRINERMKEMFEKDATRLAWSAAKWADALQCSKSTVVSTPTWQLILNTRAMREAERLKSKNYETSDRRRFRRKRPKSY
jgi:hypothetical protein